MDVVFPKSCWRIKVLESFLWAEGQQHTSSLLAAELSLLSPSAHWGEGCARCSWQEQSPSRASGGQEPEATLTARLALLPTQQDLKPKVRVRVTVALPVSFLEEKILQLLLQARFKDHLALLCLSIISWASSSPGKSERRRIHLLEGHFSVLLSCQPALTLAFPGIQFSSWKLWQIQLKKLRQASLFPILQHHVVWGEKQFVSPLTSLPKTWQSCLAAAFLHAGSPV